MCDLVQNRLRGRSRLLRWLKGCPPPRVEELAEIVERQSLTRFAPASEVEHDRRLHRREEGVTCARLAVVQEVVLVDSPILGLGDRLPDYPRRCQHTVSTEVAGTDVPPTARGCRYLVTKGFVSFTELDTKHDDAHL